MNEPTNTAAPNYLQQAYVIINVLMLLPVLIWPIPILISGNPMLFDVITPTWMLFIALFLIAVSAMDGMLYKPNNFNQALGASLWVALFTLISTATLQQQQPAWIFGVLFLTHSLRSAVLLFKQGTPKPWWAWLAWIRDITTAIIILYWVSAFSVL